MKKGFSRRNEHGASYEFPAERDMPLKVFFKYPPFSRNWGAVWEKTRALVSNTEKAELPAVFPQHFGRLFGQEAAEFHYHGNLEISAGFPEKRGSLLFSHITYVHYDSPRPVDEL